MRAGATPRERDQKRTETMPDFGKKLSAEKVRLRYVALATLPVAGFATYILGVLTGALGYDFDVWIQLQAGAWMWAAMTVLATLPGSLRESLGRICFIAGLFGFLIPITIYTVASSKSNAADVTGSEWFWFILQSGFAVIIGVAGVVGYLRLTKLDGSFSALTPATQSSHEDPSRPALYGIAESTRRGVDSMLDLLKKLAMELLRLALAGLLTFPMVWVVAYLFGLFADVFSGDLKVVIELPTVFWMWAAVVVLVMLPGSLKESIGRVSFLVGLFGLLLPLTLYVIALSVPDPPDTIFPTWWCFFIFLFAGTVFAFGGIVGYLHLTKPDALARAFAPASQASSGNPS